MEIKQLLESGDAESRNASLGASWNYQNGLFCGYGAAVCSTQTGRRKRRPAAELGPCPQYREVKRWPNKNMSTNSYTNKEMHGFDYFD